MSKEIFELNSFLQGEHDETAELELEIQKTVKSIEDQQHKLEAEAEESRQLATRNDALDDAINKLQSQVLYADSLVTHVNDECAYCAGDTANDKLRCTLGAASSSVPVEQQLWQSKDSVPALQQRISTYIAARADMLSDLGTVQHEIATLVGNSRAAAAIEVATSAALSGDQESSPGSKVADLEAEAASLLESRRLRTQKLQQVGGESHAAAALLATALEESAALQAQVQASEQAAQQCMDNHVLPLRAQVAQAEVVLAGAAAHLAQVDSGDAPLPLPVDATNAQPAAAASEPAVTVSFKDQQTALQLQLTDLLAQTDTRAREASRLHHEAAVEEEAFSSTVAACVRKENEGDTTGEGERLLIPSESTPEITAKLAHELICRRKSRLAAAQSAALELQEAVARRQSELQARTEEVQLLEEREADRKRQVEQLQEAVVAGNAKLEQLASAHTEGPDNLLAFLRAEHHKIAMVEQRNLLHSTRRMEALLARCQGNGATCGSDNADEPGPAATAATDAPCPPLPPPTDVEERLGNLLDSIARTQDTKLALLRRASDDEEQLRQESANVDVSPGSSATATTQEALVSLAAGNVQLSLLLEEAKGTMKHWAERLSTAESELASRQMQFASVHEATSSSLAAVGVTVPADPTTLTARTSGDTNDAVDPAAEARLKLKACIAERQQRIDEQTRRLAAASAEGERLQAACAKSAAAVSSAKQQAHDQHANTMQALANRRIITRREELLAEHEAAVAALRRQLTEADGQFQREFLAAERVYEDTKAQLIQHLEQITAAQQLAAKAQAAKPTQPSNSSASAPPGGSYRSGHSKGNNYRNTEDVGSAAAAMTEPSEAGMQGQIRQQSVGRGGKEKLPRAPAIPANTARAPAKGGGSSSTEAAAPAAKQPHPRPSAHEMSTSAGSASGKGNAPRPLVSSSSVHYRNNSSSNSNSNRPSAKKMMTLADNDDDDDDGWGRQALPIPKGGKAGNSKQRRKSSVA